jgi:spermidine synthase
MLGRDGRRVVHAASRDYDLVVVNVPEPSSARLNRFYTKEFLERVRGALRPGGVLVLRTATPAAYLAGERGALLAVLWRTLGEAFPDRRIVVAEAGALLLGAIPPGWPASTPEALGRRYSARAVRDESFCPEGLDARTAFEDLVFPDRAADAMVRFASLDADVNEDDRPVALLRSLVLADRASGGGLAETLRRVESIPTAAPFVLAAMLGLALAAFVLLLRSRVRACALAGRAAVATTGFAAMGLELALLLRLQGSFGHVYGFVGAVVAVFMAGLAAGGVLGSRRPSARPLRRLAVLEAAAALLCLACPWLLTRAVALPDGPALAALLVLAAAGGFVTGLEFPAAVAYRMAGGGTTVERAAGGLDAADHAGAAVGALAIGVILLPALGLGAACALAAALNGASLLALGACALHR